MQRTLTILKPDTVKSGNVGGVIQMIESEGLRICGAKMLRLSTAEAEGFYAVHKEQPFFQDLVRFMCEGPIIVMVLEAENAIERLRNLMGPTKPEAAGEGTVRKRFGTDIERNAIHGSDGEDTAAFEIGYFFSRLEIV